MQPITRVSIKDQVYRILKHKIYTKELDFGDSISISSLSHELGISNTPIREAMSMLEADGLVSATVGSRSTVIEMSEELMNSLGRTFFIIASGAYSACVLEGRVGVLRHKMEAALEEQKAMMNASDLVDEIESAIAFDRAFAEATDNKALIKFYNSKEPLLFMLTRYLYEHETDHAGNSYQQHSMLLNQLTEADYDTYQQLLYKHYNQHIPAEMK